MNDDLDDDLDRALFALPLDVPPPGLRESILRATIYAPVAIPSPFSTLETIGIGIALALAAWIAILCVADHSVVLALGDVLSELLRALSDTQTLVWLGVGALTAAAVTMTATSPRFPFNRRTS
jgi:hypothetical protein